MYHFNTCELLYAFVFHVQKYYSRKSKVAHTQQAFQNGSISDLYVLYIGGTHGFAK